MAARVSAPLAWDCCRTAGCGAVVVVGPVGLAAGLLRPLAVCMAVGLAALVALLLPGWVGGT